MIKIKRCPLLLLLLAIAIAVSGTLITSCSDNKDNKEVIIPKEPTDPEKPIDPTEPIVLIDTYLFEYDNVMEFNKVVQGNQISSLSESDIKTYFGDRVKYTTPKQVLIKEDSILIDKGYDIIDRYKFEKRGNDIHFYFNDVNRYSYKPCATLNKDVINLHIGYYKKTIVGKANIFHIGSDYELSSYNDLLTPYDSKTEPGESVLIWLKKEFKFKKTESEPNI